MVFNTDSEVILHLAMYNAKACRELHFALQYHAVRFGVLHGVLLLITGLIYRI